MEKEVIELAQSQGMQELAHAASTYIYAEIFFGVIMLIVFLIIFFKMFN